MAWPKATASPSRKLMLRTSAPTLLRTVALRDATKLPDANTVRDKLRWLTCPISDGTNSTIGGPLASSAFFLASAAAFSVLFMAAKPPPAPPNTSRTAKPTSHLRFFEAICFLSAFSSVGASVSDWVPINAAKATKR